MSAHPGPIQNKNRCVSHPVEDKNLVIRRRAALMGRRRLKLRWITILRLKAFRMANNCQLCPPDTNSAVHVLRAAFSIDFIFESCSKQATRHTKCHAPFLNCQSGQRRNVASHDVKTFEINHKTRNAPKWMMMMSRWSY